MSRKKSVLVKNPQRISRVDDPFVKVREGNLDEIKDLLYSGKLNPHKTRWSGFTTLHRAAEIGHTELCRLLVEEGGVDVNVRSARGWYTPIHIALAHGFLETATYLIHSGGNPWSKSKYGEDAFDYGAKRGFRQLCDEFKTKMLKEDMRRSIQRAVTATGPRLAESGASHVDPGESFSSENRDDEGLSSLRLRLGMRDEEPPAKYYEERNKEERDEERDGELDEDEGEDASNCRPRRPFSRSHSGSASPVSGRSQRRSGSETPGVDNLALNKSLLAYALETSSAVRPPSSSLQRNRSSTDSPSPGIVFVG